jgi:hypothetical protein
MAGKHSSPVHSAVLSLVTDLGPGKAEALALKSRASLAILEDALAEAVKEPG